jgi:hypothetical protein
MENKYIEGEFDIGYDTSYDEIVKALFTVVEKDDDKVYAGVMPDRRVSELATLVEKAPDTPILRIFEVFRMWQERSNIFGHYHYDTSHILGRLAADLLGENYDSQTEDTYHLESWEKMEFTWDNGNIVIDIDTHRAYFYKCGDYAKFRLCILAMNNFGLFAQDKFSFAYQQGKDVDPQMRAMFHCAVDGAAIEWSHWKPEK